MTTLIGNDVVVYAVNATVADDVLLVTVICSFVLVSFSLAVETAIGVQERHFWTVVFSVFS